MRLTTTGLGVGLAVLTSMLGCGDDDNGGSGAQTDAAQGGRDAAQGGSDAAAADGGADRDAAPGSYPLQLIRPACAPNDAPSIRILLGSGIIDATCAVNDIAGSVTLELWTTEIVAPVTFTFAPTEAIGRGQICPGGNAPCLVYETGEIHFDTYKEGAGASGTWQLVADDEPMSGTFDTTWCDPDPPEPCG